MTRVGLRVMKGHSTVVTRKREDLSVGSTPSIVYVANPALMIPPGKKKRKGVMFLLEAGAVGNQLSGY